MKTNNESTFKIFKRAILAHLPDDIHLELDSLIKLKSQRISKSQRMKNLSLHFTHHPLQGEQ